MQRFVVIFLAILFGFLCVQEPANAISVNLILFNSNELLDLTTSTALPGTSEDGYLVEILWAGADGVIDPLVTPGFTPGGDDEILRDIDGDAIGITHIGAGMSEEESNGYVELFLSAIDYDYYAAQGSTNLYVRFYNVDDPQVIRQQGGEVWWGESEVFDIPMPDRFYFSEVDFAPVTSFSTMNMVSIPEPFSLTLFFTAICSFAYARKHRIS